MEAEGRKARKPEGRRADAGCQRADASTMALATVEGWKVRRPEGRWPASESLSIGGDSNPERTRTITRMITLDSEGLIAETRKVGSTESVISSTSFRAPLIRSDLPAFRPSDFLSFRSSALPVLRASGPLVLPLQQPPRLVLGGALVFPGEGFHLVHEGVDLVRGGADEAVAFGEDGL